MVQMKEIVPAAFLSVGRFLYIPHGSDESLYAKLKDLVPEFALYPTWFR